VGSILGALVCTGAACALVVLRKVQPLLAMQADLRQVRGAGDPGLIAGHTLVLAIALRLFKCFTVACHPGFLGEPSGSMHCPPTR
jgi:hypothetical protein